MIRNFELIDPQFLCKVFEREPLVEQPTRSKDLGGSPRPDVSPRESVDE